LPRAGCRPAVCTAAPAKLAEGFSNDEIGGRLYISAETVRTHVQKAMRKLGAGTRTQAVAKAIRAGVIA
jgi:DNA-binding NarL/FixJ family response regulator